MKGKLEEFINLPYSIEVLPNQTTDGSFCYLAYHPELPGCMSHGTTPQEAIDNLREARELYIKILLERGQEVPLPILYSPTVIWEFTEIGPEILQEMPNVILKNVSSIQFLEK